MGALPNSAKCLAGEWLDSYQLNGMILTYLVIF